MDNINRHFYKNITLEQALVGGKFKIQLEDGSTVKVKLRPGSYSGQIIRLKNLSENIKNMATEDTLITLNVLDHPMYHIDGLNLEAAVILTPAEAKVGTKKKLPGPDGKPFIIDFPKDCKQSQKIVIQNRGLSQKEIRGDLIFIVKIEDLSSIEDEIRDSFMSMQKPDILH